MTSTSEANHPVVFTTRSAYSLPSQKFMIPTSWRRYQLSQLVNKALSLPQPIPFDFLVRGEILRTTLGEWCAEKGIGQEETLEVEYFESVMPPQRMSNLPHEDWVSSVSCQLDGYVLTASYDGKLRLFDYSQKLLNTSAVHNAPITSIAVVPTASSSSSRVVASASHDLTARLTSYSFSEDSGATRITAQTTAALHLHTAPVSSIAASSSGSHLLTSSWDTLIGVWDTSVPSADEVPLEETDRKKRRKVEDESSRPRRKAPLSVLKSHTARVSKAVFGPTSDTAYSCGFDSTIRSWDVENGVCTNTITASAKPFLDLAITASGNSALAASTDRTVCHYDLRAAPSSSTTPSNATLHHPATPSCIVASPASGSAPTAVSSAEHQLLTGAYDGVVRLWDLRSVKSAVTSFKVLEGTGKAGQKVLSVDWARGVVGVGGEGGVEIWRLGQGDRVISS